MEINMISIIFRILILNCLYLAYVHNFSIDPSVLDKTNAKSSLLDSSELANVKCACPREKSFCIPRLQCPFRFLVYDREIQKGFQPSDQFKDEFGCGAFEATWTYVCCSSLANIQTEWTPSPQNWFLQSDSSGQIASVPTLSLWPESEGDGEHEVNSTSSDEGHKKSPFLSDDDRSFFNNTTGHSSEEDRVGNDDKDSLQPITDQPDNRVQENNPIQNPFLMFPQLIPNFPLGDGFQRMAFFQPPAFNPNLPQPNSPWSSQDPNSQRVWPNPVVFGHETVRISSPAGTQTETFFLLPNGAIQRVITNHPVQPVSQQQPVMLNSPLVSPNLQNFPGNTLSGLNPNTFQNVFQFPNDGVDVKDNAEDSTTADDSKQRTRREAESGTSFKIFDASGGLWLGANASSNASESRALPKAGQFWGGQGNIPPVYPLPPSLNVNNDRCGMSFSMGINARILPSKRIDGPLLSETSFGEYPWHVAIVNGQTGIYLCGGAIISARFVLTVAHCVRKYQFTYLLVRVGDWDVATNNEMLPSYDVEVADILIHENFYAGNLQNDIALLRLKYPLDFSIIPHAGTICLPPGEAPIYQECVVTGWGQQLATNEAKGDLGTYSRILKQSRQQLMNPQYCEQALRPYLGTFYQFPKQGFVCAYDQDGQDACFGDGGGALACKLNIPNYRKSGQYHVVGLVSWGIGCGLPNVPSSFTAIWNYLNWIQDKISRYDPYTTMDLNTIYNSNWFMPRSKDASTTVAAPAAPMPDVSGIRLRSSVDNSNRDYVDLAFGG